MLHKRQNNFIGVCSKCATDYSCCHETMPPITDERRKIIETYLRKKRIHIENPFVITDYVFPRLDVDGYCVFHDRQTRKCKIHSVKPETCVAGPITFDINGKNAKIEWHIKMQKICQLAGVVYANKSLLQKHLEAAKKEIRRLVDEIDSSALKAILKKDEPETFKIDEERIRKDITSKVV